MFDGLSLDPIALLVDGRSPAEVGVGRCHVVWALMVKLLVVVLDEGCESALKVDPTLTLRKLLILCPELEIGWGHSRRQR